MFPSIMRTLVPMLAGWVITLLTGLGLTVDSGTVAGGITVVVAGAYYIVFRVAERVAERLRVPWLRTAAGLALGYATPPRYKSTDDVEALIRASRT